MSQILKNKQKIKCLFGYHDYKIPHKNNPFVLLCKHCKRFGHRKFSNGYEVWYEYDEKGNEIHCKWSDGYEIWREYDEEGNMIHSKRSDGYEVWYDEKGNVIKTKEALK